MSLQKIRITGYTDEELLDEIDSSQDFDDQPFYEAMINPDAITWQRSVNYKEEQAPDTSSTSQTYQNTPSETLSFDIMIDCTGGGGAARGGRGGGRGGGQGGGGTDDGTGH